MRGQLPSDSVEPIPERPVQYCGDQSRKPWIAPEVTKFDAVAVTKGFTPPVPGDGINNLS